MSKPRKLAFKHVSVLTALILLVYALLGKKPPVQVLQTRETETAQAVTVGRARVTKIVDGDTIYVQLAKSEGEIVDEKLRLFGINTPELHQRPGPHDPNFHPEFCAQEASDFVESLCPVGSEIQLEQHERDIYGRLLAVVFLPDGKDLNRAILEKGLGKAYFPGSNKTAELKANYKLVEEQARLAHLGIWDKKE